MTKTGAALIAWWVLAFFQVAGAEGAARRWSEFPTRNEYLKEQIANDPERGLPRHERVYWTIDADIFKPAFLNGDSVKYSYYPYHGIGGWIENRVEVLPLENLRLNLKLVPWYGTDSYGYHDAARFETYFGLTFDDDIADTGLKWKSRFGDLGFRTVGLGLFYEDRPMNGVDLRVMSENVELRALVNGTGALAISGDLGVYEISLWQDRLVLGRIGITKFDYEKGRLRPVTYLTSSHDLGAGFGVGAAAGTSAAGQSYLVRFKAARDYESVGFLSEPQVRWYDDGVAGTFERATEQDYTGYDQQSQPYTNPINAFRTEDHLFVAAWRNRAFWRPHRSIELYGDLEVGSFVFKEGQPREDFLFWEGGARFFPMSQRQDYIGLAATNKLITAVGENAVPPGNPPDYYSVLPASVDRDQNKPRFIKQNQIVFRLHGRF